MYKSISISELKKIMQCEHSYLFHRNILRENVQQSFIISVLEQMKQLLIQEKTIEHIFMDLSDYIDKNMFVEWYENSISYHMEKQNLINKIFRLVTYIYNQQAKVICINYEINLYVNELRFSSLLFNRVHDYVDLVLKRGSKYEAIIFKIGSPKYSYKARKATNSYVNSIELAVMYHALKDKFPSLLTSIYYFDNKHDTVDILENYENKKGNNIISMEYEAIDVEAHIHAIISLQKSQDCSNCKFNKLCSYTGEIKNINNHTPIKVTQKTVYTDKQLEVVNHVNGPMNVIAIPGSGKTKSLVGRLENLLSIGVNPTNILFLTFTNKACEEIKERVAQILPEESTLPNIFTFNGLGYHILNENSKLIGRKILADNVDRLTLIGDVLGSVEQIKGVSYQYLNGKFGLIARCEGWFNHISKHGVADFIRTHSNIDYEGIINAYKDYITRFRAFNYISFDEQITLCNQLLNSFPRLLEYYSKQFKYIMVDEFQDVDAEQVKLVYSLASYHKNIVVVGDDDQSIYRFRGGSKEYLINFSNVFINTHTVILDTNFRSNHKILDTSFKIINKNNSRIPKSFIANINAESQPLLYNFNNDIEIVNMIRRLNNKVSLGDIAIISRNNSTLCNLASILSPYYKCSSPKDYLIDDTIFLLINDLLTLYHNGFNNDDAIYRLSKIAGIDIFSFKTDKYKSFIDNLINKSLIPCITNTTPVEEISNYKETSILHFIKKILLSFQEIRYSIDLHETIRNITYHWCDVVEDHPVLGYMSNLIKERRIKKSLVLFEHINLLIKFDDKTRIIYDKREDCITLLTAHDSKGKEFPCVLLILNDFNDAITDLTSLEEERNLLFVATTRAQNNLIICNSRSSNKFVDELEDTITRIS